MLLFQHNLSWHRISDISLAVLPIQTTTQLAVGPILFSHQSHFFFLQAFGAQWAIILNGDQSTVSLQHQSLKSLLEDTLKRKKHETLYQQHSKQLMGILTGENQCLKQTLQQQNQQTVCAPVCSYELFQTCNVELKNKAKQNPLNPKLMLILSYYWTDMLYCILT